MNIFGANGRTPLRSFMLSIFVIYLSIPTLALELQQKKSRGSQLLPITQNRSANNEEELAAAIIQVRTFAERAQSFDNLDVKVEAVMHFADLLWRYDESFARQLFFNALDSVGTAISGPSKDSGFQAEKGRLRPEQLIGLRSRILARFARHDPATAKQRAKIGSDEDQIAMNLFTALELVKGDDIPVAVDFARQGLRGPQLPRADLTITFLNRLRRADQQAADSLFPTVLSRFTSTPELRANDLLTLGYYVFTYPGNQSSSDDSMRFVMVGRVGTVNIGGNRSGVLPELVRLYLETCANVLSRPIQDREKKQEYYVAAYQLRQKAEIFAPNLVPRLTAAMQAMLAEVPSSLGDAATYNNLTPRTAPKSNAPYDLNAVLSKIEKESSSEARDLGYLDVAYSLFQKGEFEIGREVSERINDLNLRGKTMRLMEFGIGVRALESGNTSAAEGAARRLDRGIESVELWLGIADAYLKEGNGISGAEAVRTAVKLSSDIDAAQRPYVVLAAAGKLAKFDPVAGLKLLGESIALFNSVGEAEPRWTISLGIRETTFEFQLQGIDSGNIAPAIKQLASGDREAVIAAILPLKRERILGRSLMVLSSVILKKE